MSGEDVHVSKVFAGSFVSILRPLAMSFQEQLENLSKSQQSLQEKIDGLQHELEENMKINEFIDIRRGIDKLSNARKQSQYITSTLGSISERLSRLRFLAESKFPELVVLQREKHRKLLQEATEIRRISSSVETSSSSGSSLINRLLLKEEDWNFLKSYLPERFRDKLGSLNIPSLSSILFDSKRFNDRTKPNPMIPAFFEAISQRTDTLLLLEVYPVGSDTMVVNDVENQTVVTKSNKTSEVIGAFCSFEWKDNHGQYFGNKEVFLFTLQPHQKVFKVSGKNEYFVLTREEGIAFGGGGSFFLWIDSSFQTGSSNECSTFEEGMLTSDEDFKINSLQVISLI